MVNVIKMHHVHICKKDKLLCTEKTEKELKIVVQCQGTSSWSIGTEIQGVNPKAEFLTPLSSSPSRKSSSFFPRTLKDLKRRRRNYR